MDGSIPVLPGFLDFHAANNPGRPWALFTSPTGGSSSISFEELARATHRLAHSVRPNRYGSDGEVVALVANCDTILYVAAIIGLIRAGLVVRFTLYAHVTQGTQRTVFSLFLCPPGTRLRQPLT